MSRKVRLKCGKVTCKSELAALLGAKFKSFPYSIYEEKNNVYGVILDKEGHEGLTKKDSAKKRLQSDISLLSEDEGNPKHSLFVYRLERFVGLMPAEAICKSINDSNDGAEVEMVVKIKSLTNVIKIVCATEEAAQRLCDHGFIVENMKIRPSNVQKQIVANLKACFRCYGTDHLIAECKLQEAVCKKCGKPGHLAKGCKLQVAKCLGCGGPHTANSFLCPQRKQQEEVKKRAIVKSYISRSPGSYAAAVSQTVTNKQTVEPPAPEVRPHGVAGIQKTPMGEEERQMALHSADVTAAATIFAQKAAKGDPEVYRYVFNKIRIAEQLPELNLPRIVLKVVMLAEEATTSEPLRLAISIHEGERRVKKAKREAEKEAAESSINQCLSLQKNAKRHRSRPNLERTETVKRHKSVVEEDVLPVESDPASEESACVEDTTEGSDDAIETDEGSAEEEEEEVEEEEEEVSSENEPLSEVEIKERKRYSQAYAGQMAIKKTQREMPDISIPPSMIREMSPPEEHWEKVDRRARQERRNKRRETDDSSSASVRSGR